MATIRGHVKNIRAAVISVGRIPGSENPFSAVFVTD